MRSPASVTLQALQIHDVLRRARALAGAEEASPICPPDCTRCCSAGFDVSATDTVVAIERLRRMPPGLRADILQRLHVAIGAEEEAMAALGLLLPEGVPPSLQSLGEEGLDDLCDALLATPCPFQDPETARCLLETNAPEPCHLRGQEWVDPLHSEWVLDMRCDETEHLDRRLSVPLRAQQRAAARLLNESSAVLGLPADERFTWPRAIVHALKSFDRDAM